jgi:hypothetical protein
MSGSCATFNETLFNQAINTINSKDVTNGAFELDLKQCQGSAMMGGKKKMRGGVNKSHVKTAIYSILAILSAISLTGEGAKIIITGITMIINGQCGWLQNRLFFQNPLCTYWNNLIIIVGKAIIGDPMAITQLTGATIALATAPKTLDVLVDGIAGTIAGSIPEIENGILSIGNGGGKKSKKYGVKSKKSNKSRRSIKYRRSRKYRKSRK